MTPTRQTYDLRNRTVVCDTGDQLDQSIEMEEKVEDILQEAEPQVMVDNVYEALTEEIKTLQVGDTWQLEN
jgi:hypothetical protein